MTHLTLSEALRPVVPSRVIAQRSSCILCPIVQLQNSHSHRGQGSHSHRVQRICSAPRAFSIQDENRNVPRDSCLWELCLGSLSHGACDIVRGWGPHTILHRYAAPCQPSQPDAESVESTAFCLWSIPLVRGMHKSCHSLHWCQNGTLLLPVAGCYYGGKRRKKCAFLSVDWAGTLPPLGLQSGLKDSVVHRDFPQAVSPATRAATVCSHLAPQCWHLFQLLSAGVVGGVCACRCVSAPSTLLNSIRLPL